ncbi:hypothetical protein [Sphingomonas sp. BK580]|uniref:hypothetical protein n=1 Tax=Sphingomonas sp. BK580 TaxID=2586972 RepID=UPI0016151A22|nr:hypothetical protein [Sphingomonas sp. BK580]MBB3693021.1 hypothetical protein [Sphingomonas sp. BK580]
MTTYSASIDPALAPSPKDGPRDFLYVGDAHEWLAEHGMDAHPSGKTLGRRIYRGNELSGWAEITIANGKVTVAPIADPYEADPEPGHTITFDDAKPCRIQDGTSRTHSDLGVIVSADTGKTYRFWASPSHERVTTAWVRRGVHYGVVLHDDRGHRVRDGACENLKAAIEPLFKARVRALAMSL